jgi:mannose-6-phosphate isomerase-like protein (cupin superfamily)
LTSIRLAIVFARYDALPMATDFVIRDWRLDPFEGDQAPTHIHHAGEEAFVCLEGDLSVTIDGTRTRVQPGGYVVVPRGTAHTFATPGGAHVLAVMSPEIADLVDGLHADLDEQQRFRLWERCHSSLVG